MHCKVSYDFDHALIPFKYSDNSSYFSTDRAIYVNKFEAVDEDVLEITSSIFNSENVIDLNNTCLCESENISSLCNDTKLFDILIGTNSSAFVTKKLMPINNGVFAVIVSSDFIWIYSYIAAEEQLYREAGESIIKEYYLQSCYVNEADYKIMKH